MNWIETRLASQSATFTVLEMIEAFFLLLIVSETFWDLITKKRANGRESFANIFIGVVYGLVDRAILGVILVLGLFGAELLTPLAIPLTWWSWILAVLVADFSYYWMHRFEHEVRVLWAIHAVHHSSPEFNLTTAIRLAWVEGVIEWLFFVPMVLIGFDPVQSIAALAMVIGYQTWIHTEKIGTLGWLDGVLNTPSVHRVHHGSNHKYLDRNYGGILIIWDRMFGTYQKEEEKVVYGLTQQLGTSNPFMINAHEFIQITKDIKGARSFKQVVGYLFGRPGWRPDP